MQTLRKAANIILIILTGFLALTAFGGGISLMANLYTPPVESLSGSIFSSFFVPGLALFALAGGSALLAAILLVRKSRYAALSAATAGVVIMFFEFVQVMVIGSDLGAAGAMQSIYFGLGTLIVVLAFGVWFIDLYTESN